MKRNPTPKHDLETIIPLLIQQWRRLHKLSGPEDRLQTREFRSVVKAVEQLQAYFSTVNDTPAVDYFSDIEPLGAYLLYHWCLSYQEGLSLLSELPSPPKRVLDVCSGPAPYAFAALRYGAADVIATDRNLEALKLGAEVCGRYGMPLTVRRWDCQKDPCPADGKFDLIILAHALEELFPMREKGWVQKQYAFMQSLFDRLEPEGHILLVDNSSLQTNHRILAMRDALVKEGVPVLAPCVWSGECPALQTKNSPCYAQREFEKPYIIREIQRAASINLSSLKMSYIIFRHPDAGWPSLPDKELYRVISPPVESHMGKTFYLCGVEGKKRLSSRVEKLPKAAKAFDFLRRGELISIENPCRHGIDFEVANETAISIEAALGKTIPIEYTSKE